MPLLKHNFHKNILYLFKVSLHKIRQICMYIYMHNRETIITIKTMNCASPPKVSSHLFVVLLTLSPPSTPIFMQNLLLISLHIL